MANMIYKNKEYRYFSNIFNEGLRLAKEDPNEAIQFFNAYIRYIYEDADDVHSLEEAEARAKKNFGYWAGYYNEMTCELIYNTYNCSHPIFGRYPYGVAPEDAFKKGMEMGEAVKEQQK